MQIMNVPSLPETIELKLVRFDDPVLHEEARFLTKAEILSEKTQNLIKAMKESLHKEQGVGLAAPQVGFGIQLCVIENSDLSFLSAEQIKERECEEIPFHVVINPIIKIEGDETTDFFEGCLSLPGKLGIVPRARCVHVIFFNEKAELQEVHAKGWYARILQHEIDHLFGKMYSEKAYPETMITEDEYRKKFLGKSIKEILRILVQKNHSGTPQ